MKNKLILGFVTCGVLICIISLTVFQRRSGFFSDPRKEMREDLANKLGVRIEDYPYESAFPVGYFFTVLQPGMTITEVHNIVQGYEKVLHCKNKSEIYFYYSSEVESSKRFEIRYDDQKKFVNLQGEEEDSRTIQTFGCEPGKIE